MMKPFFIVSSIIFGCFLLIAPVFALTSNTIGGTTYFSDGTTATTIGGTTYFSDGTTMNTLGGTTYFSNGMTANTLGGTTYFSDGTTANTLGGTTYFNDGTTMNTLGGTTYINTPYVPRPVAPIIPRPYVPVVPSITPSVPVYTCSSYGHGSYLGADSRCRCSQGYDWNSAMTQCVQNVVCGDGYVTRNNQCLSYTQDCQGSYGFYVHGVKGQTDNTSSCYCNAGYQWNTGYQWNSTTTSCVPLPAVVEITPTVQVELPIPISPPLIVKPVPSKPKPITCTSGTALSLDKKYCISIPEHAHAVQSRTDVWKCDDGYVEKKDLCVVELVAPSNIQPSPLIEDKPILTPKKKGFFERMKTFFKSK